MDGDEKDLLTALIFGALHEQNPVTGVDFAVKLAICARMTHGNQEEYAKAVKRAFVVEERMTDLFPRQEAEEVIRSFMRAVRRARNDPVVISELTAQFVEPQTDEIVLEYLLAAERSLASNFIGNR